MSLTGTLSNTEQAMLSNLCDLRLQALLEKAELTAGESEESQLLSELSLKLAMHLPVQRAVDVVVVNAREITAGTFTGKPVTPAELVMKLVKLVMEQDYVGGVSTYIEHDCADLNIYPVVSEELLSCKLLTVEIEQDGQEKLQISMGTRHYSQAEFYTYMQGDFLKDIEQELKDY